MKNYKYIALGVIIAVAIVAALLLYYNYQAPSPTACPVLVYRSPNLTTTKAIINAMAIANPCYGIYVNLSASTLEPGFTPANSIPYVVPQPGTIYVQRYNYTYTLNSTQAALLENESASHNCFASFSLRFFKLNTSASLSSCNGKVYG